MNYGNTYRGKRKVAIYARVSTEHEAQLSALANQKDWYSPILGIHPEWEVVKMYADEGVTGTAAYKRRSFMLFFASTFWKKLQAKMEKSESPKRRKLQAFTVDSY